MYSTPAAVRAALTDIFGPVSKVAVITRFAELATPSPSEQRGGIDAALFDFRFITARSGEFAIVITASRPSAAGELPDAPAARAATELTRSSGQFAASGYSINVSVVGTSSMSLSILQGRPQLLLDLLSR